MDSETNIKLLDSGLNPCVKTGCSALIGGTFYHGDLFHFGNHYILNCNQPGQQIREGSVMIHLMSYTWDMFLQSGKVVILKVRDAEWTSYDGKVIQIGGPK